MDCVMVEWDVPRGCEVVATFRQPVPMPGMLALLEVIEQLYGKDCVASGQHEYVLVWRKKNGPGG